MTTQTLQALEAVGKTRVYVTVHTEEGSVSLEIRERKDGEGEPIVKVYLIRDQLEQVLGSDYRPIHRIRTLASFGKIKLVKQVAEEVSLG